jgi:hypothetical protein
VYKGISWEDELCIKAFWWFCKADLLAVLEQNSSHAFAPVFKQTEGEGDAPVGWGGVQEEGGNYLWELVFYM